MSDHAHHMMMMDAPPPLDASAIVARARAAGLTAGFTLSLPKTPGGTWTAAYMPDKVEDTRTLYLAAATGQALAMAQDGCTFAQLCEQLCDPDDAERTVERVGGLLGGWLQDGLVCSAG